MSSIKVSWQEIQSAADGCDSQRKELADYISSLRGVKAYRAISGGAYASIYKTLDKIIDGLEAEKKSLRNLSSGLAAVKETYMEAENKIAGNVSSSPAETAGAKDNPFKITWSDVWSVFAEGGILGKGRAILGSVVTGDWSVDSFLDIVGYKIAAIGDAAEAVENGTEAEWMKALFGVRDVFDNKIFKDVNWDELTVSQRTRTALVGSIKSGIKEVIPDTKMFQSGAKVADQLSSFAKWGGTVLTVGSNLLENIEEFKGQDGKFERLVNETMIESTVDIALDVVAAAGVTAAAAALGITSAPAVAVGAAAVGVTWAANGVCKWATGGRDIGEAFADLICDSHELIRSREYTWVRWALV